MVVDDSSSATEILLPQTIRAEHRLPAWVTDDVLADRIDRAVARIRRYCRWHVFPNRREEIVLDGEGQRSILLPSLRVTAVHAVAARGEPVDPSGFDWSQDGRLRRRGGRWPDGFRNVTVDIEHGYEVDDLADLTDVLMGMVVRAATVPVGVASQTTGDVSVAYRQGVEASLRPTLGDREVLDELKVRVH